MPIKGLTDNVLPAFPRLGKLRKGGPSVEKQTAEGKKYSSYGADLEYFRFTSERPEVQTAFNQTYGAKPALLSVYLPYVTIDDNWQAWQEEWSGSGLVHRCDGETMVIWRTPDGKYSQTPKPCPYHTKPELRTRKTPGCVKVGRLTVVLPELIQAGFVGFVTLETHGGHDVRSIQATLLAAFDPRNPRGLQGIPFTLRRVKETVSTPRPDGSRVMAEKWMVKLVPTSEWVTLQLQAARTLALSSEGQPLQLTSGKLVDQRTGEVLDEPDDEDVVEAEAVTQVTTPQPDADAAAGLAEMQSASAERAAETTTATTTAFVPPVCPKCGGPMWDNRAKRKQAEDEGKPKPPPAWACKAGKYDPETKQRTGCDGVIWPSDPNEEKPAKKAKPSEQIVAAIIADAQKLYGNEAGKTMRGWLIDNYQITDAKSLKEAIERMTPDQADDVYGKLRARLDEAAGAEVDGWGRDAESK